MQHLQPNHLRKLHSRAEDTIAQFHKGTELPLLGPAAARAMVRCVLAGFQLQTSEPQAAAQEFQLFGLSSTFFCPASAGIHITTEE